MNTTMNTILVEEAAALDRLIDRLGDRLDELEMVHPDWADWCEDGSEDLTLHDQLTEAVGAYYDLQDAFFPHRPLYTCALVTYGKLATYHDYTVGY